MENTKLTPGEMLYRKLLTLKGQKVFLRRPPDVERRPKTFDCDFSPAVYWLESVGKRKSIIRGSYAPRSNPISVSNKRIVESAIWDNAIDQWEKNEVWHRLQKN